MGGACAMSSHMRLPPLIATALLLTGCASSRLLRVENRLLRQENDRLSEQVATWGPRVNGEDFALVPDLDVLDRWLTEADYRVGTSAGSDHLHLEFSGENCDFALNVQYFADQHVVFMTTGSYLALSDTRDTDSITLLLVQLATYNYDLLLGKYQLEPETGAVALSMELTADDGLSRQAFLDRLLLLVSTADHDYPTLHGLAQGEGL